jgi:hypothetical protein
MLTFNTKAIRYRTSRGGWTELRQYMLTMLENLLMRIGDVIAENDGKFGGLSDEDLEDLIWMQIIAM